MLVSTTNHTTSPSKHIIIAALLDGEQAWTSILNLKSLVMDSVQVGKAVFGKESYATLGIEPRTYSNPGRFGNPYSVCWVKKYHHWYYVFVLGCSR